MKNTIRWALGAAVIVAAPVAMAQTVHIPTTGTVTSATATVFNPVVPPVTNSPPPPPPQPVPPTTTPVGLAIQSVSTPQGVAGLTARLTAGGLSSGSAAALANAATQVSSGGQISLVSVNQAISSFNDAVAGMSRQELVSLAGQERTPPTNTDNDSYTPTRIIYRARDFLIIRSSRP